MVERAVLEKPLSKADGEREREFETDRERERGKEGERFING